METSTKKNQILIQPLFSSLIPNYEDLMHNLKYWKKLG
jgi:hypothetical protein